MENTAAFALAFQYVVFTFVVLFGLCSRFAVRSIFPPLCMLVFLVHFLFFFFFLILILFALLGSHLLLKIENLFSPL